MDDQRYLLILLIILLVIVRFLLVFSYYVLSQVKLARLENMADVHDKKAEKLLKLLDNEDRIDLTYKSATLFTTISIIAILGTLVASNYLWMAFLLSWFLLITFTLVLPQAIVRVNPEGLALKFVFLIQILLTLFLPFYWLFRVVSLFWKIFFKPDEQAFYNEQELLNIVEKAQSEGSLDQEEGELIRRSIEFNELDVYSILTPRVDVVAINIDWDYKKQKEVIEESEFSRLPVYRDNIDTIIGVIHAKDFHRMKERGQTFESIIKPVIFTPTYYEVSKLLRQFQVSKNHMAVVVDEYGGTAGIITLEDIIEELVGEIWDEYDDIEHDIQAINPVQYLVSGNTTLETFFETFNIDDADLEYDPTTVGGWVLDEMNKIPDVGEQFRFNHLTITIMDSDDRRVYRIMVNIEQLDDESNDEEKE